MAILNMRLVTEVQPIARHDFAPANVQLLNPDGQGASSSSPLHLLDGEFLGLNSSYQLDRPGISAYTVTGGDPAGDPDAANASSKVPQFAFWLERGRYDARAIAGGRATVLMGSGWEADFHADVLANADLDSTDPDYTGGLNVGDALYVSWSENGANGYDRRRVLTKRNTGGLLHAYVTRVWGTGDTYALRALIVTP